MKKSLFLMLLLAAVACQPKATYKVDVQAHRGGMGLYPEESLAAMKNAVDLGVNTLEMDLCITQDNKVILSHDKYFHHRYATDPEGNPVKAEDPKVYLYQIPYSEVVKWDVGMRENPEWPEKHCIPAVKPVASEVIRTVEAYVKEKGLSPVSYNIEIKSEETSSEGVEGVNWPDYREYADRCVNMLDSLGLGDRLIIQCFDVRTLNYINEKYPGHHLSYLLGAGMQYEKSMAKLNFIPEWFSPEYRFVNAELMEKAHRDGMKVVTWTVDDPAEMRNLLDLKVEAIISNYPDRLLKEAKDYGAYER